MNRTENSKILAMSNIIYREFKERQFSKDSPSADELTRQYNVLRERAETTFLRDIIILMSNKIMEKHCGVNHIIFDRAFKKLNYKVIVEYYPPI